MRNFGRYQVVRQLGAGGMGDVFLARDELLGRDVAVKTLRPLGMPAHAAELFRARFVNEARAVASLAHPNIVQVFDLGFDAEVPYIVMEVVGGRSLRDRTKTGERLGAAEARRLGTQIARALDAAHARGIVHRDVKPGNVLEAEPGLWKLADFGVAHVPDSTLTITGQFVGSPAYASPEGLLAGEFSPATDVYGLGATLYEALCGQPPYGDPAQVNAAFVARQRDPTGIAQVCPSVPADLARLVDSALSRDPRARPTAAQLAAGLEGRALPTAPAPAPAPMPAPAFSVIDAAAAKQAVADASRRAVSLARRLLDHPAARRRTAWVAGGIAAVVILLLIGLSLSADQPRRPSSSPGRSAAESYGYSVPEWTPRSREQRKHWDKAQRKLAERKYEDAARELEKVLDRNPDDAEARQLLQSLKAASGGRWNEPE
jgi:serine/threonine-protein kinase